MERSLAGVRRQLGRTPGRLLLRLRPRLPGAAAGPLRATLLWDAYHDTMTATLKVRCQLASTRLRLCMKGLGRSSN